MFPSPLLFFPVPRVFHLRVDSSDREYISGTTIMALLSALEAREVAGSVSNPLGEMFDCLFDQH